MCVALPRPIERSGMLDQILTNILDHSLLDAKGIMEKYSSFSCNNILNKKWAWSCHAPRDVDQTSTIHLQTLLMYIELLQKK